MLYIWLRRRDLTGVHLVIIMKKLFLTFSPRNAFYIRKNQQVATYRIYPPNNILSPSGEVTGYFAELFYRAAEATNVSYELVQSIDGSYGHRMVRKQ